MKCAGPIGSEPRCDATVEDETVMVDAQKSIARTGEKVADSAVQIERSTKEVEASTERVEDSADRRTVLAGDRTVLAAERTYAAGVRTGLVALASGIGAKKLQRHPARSDDGRDRQPPRHVRRVLFRRWCMARSQPCLAAATA